MKQSGKMRFAAVLVTVIWVCLEVWAVGPVMRESDQASLLEGAVNLANRSSSWSDNDSYNYDKQYFSYWVVAAWLKVRGVVEVDGSVPQLVREGNLLAVVLFSLALLAAVGSQRKWSSPQVAALYCALFTPVLAFSGMLLSPNMISAAFVLTIVVMLRRNETAGEEADPGPSLVRIGLVALIAWAATAARQDVILLMPLLALLARRGEPLRALFHDKLVGAMAGGCIAAMVGGYLLSATHTAMPKPFFVPQSFVAYLGGGLGVLLLLVLLFAARLGFSGSLRRTALGAAVLVPLLFYCCVLYTPRHLFLAAMAVLLTIFFDRGREAWISLAASRLGRVVIVLTVLGTLVFWVVGVRMSGMKSGRPVMSAATLFPSTDGFWPLGAHSWFFSRLAQSSREPVDHNQQVWAAWNDVDLTLLPPGRGAALSSGLVSYATLHLAWAGAEEARRIEDADYVVFDGRTLGKRQRGVNNTEGPNRSRLLELLKHGNVRVIGAAFGQRIFLWTPGKSKEINARVSLKLALYEHFGGNDFRLERDLESVRLKELEGHRAVLVCRSEARLQKFRRALMSEGEIGKVSSSYDSEPWAVLPLTASELRGSRKLLDEGEEGIWIAFGTLPSFMDVRSYAK